METKGAESKNKSLKEKKLEFSQEDSGFVFKHRNPFTRSKISKGKMPEKIPTKPEKEKLPLEEEIAELSPAEAG